MPPPPPPPPPPTLEDSLEYLEMGGLPPCFGHTLYYLGVMLPCGQGAGERHVGFEGVFVLAE